MIYQVKKDINILDQVITKDTIINFGDNDVFNYPHKDGTTSTIRKSFVESNTELFSKLESNYQELNNTEEIKRYRIQLDINCKYTDLDRIRKIIEQSVTEVLND